MAIPIGVVVRVSLGTGGELVDLILISVLDGLILSSSLECDSQEAEVVVGIHRKVVGDADPINYLAVSIASCLLSSLVITIVLVAVVGVGLTTLLKVDNLP